MLNFRSYYRFCFIFCCIVQILSFNSRLEAKTRHHSSFEFNTDPNAIRNCDNLDDKIDCFIDAGMQYQQATSKNFEYKKFLKQTYKHLEKQNIYVDEKTKKDLKKQIKNRISERFFGHQTNKTSVGQESPGQANRHNPNGRYSNDFREGIVEVGTGIVFIASEVPPLQAVGIGLVVDGSRTVIKATINYV